MTIAANTKHESERLVSRLTVTLACVVLLSGCAATATGNSGSTVSEIELAKQAVYSCNQRGVRQYDDGRSSIKQVALVIADACEREWMNYVKLTRPVGRRTPYMVRWYHGMRLRQREQAAQAVIAERSRQASR